MLNGKELALVVGQAGPLVDHEHRRALAGDGVVVHVEALVLGICFWREAPETAVGADRRAGKRGVIITAGPNEEASEARSDGVGWMQRSACVGELEVEAESRPSASFPHEPVEIRHMSCLFQ